MNIGREEECLETLARLRNKHKDDIGVRVEYLEIKALKEFETRTAAEKYPQYQDGSLKSNFMIGLNDYKSLVTNRSLLKRTMVACLTMTFQQCESFSLLGSSEGLANSSVGNGINAINYYAPLIFQDFKLAGNTTALLATGVVGVLEFLFTIPAVLYVDHFGRKSILLVGAIGMAACHFVVAGIIGSFSDNWQAHLGGGWAAVAFIWVFICFFAFSWGPVAWILVSEVFPMSMRAKGVSVVSIDLRIQYYRKRLISITGRKCQLVEQFW